mgnify:CR=1 FL=1
MSKVFVNFETLFPDKIWVEPLNNGLIVIDQYIPLVLFESTLEESVLIKKVTAALLHIVSLPPIVVSVPTIINAFGVGLTVIVNVLVGP